MGPRKKKIVDVERNLPDDIVEVFTNSEENIPCTKYLVSEKPHLSALQQVEVDDSLRELYKFNNDFQARLIKESETENHAKNEALFRAIITLIEAVSELPVDYYDFSHFIKCVSQVAHHIHSQVLSLPIREKIVSLCEKTLVCHREKIPSDSSNSVMVVGTLTYLLDLTLSEVEEGEKPIGKSQIKRVWKLRSFITKTYFCTPEPPFDHLRELLLDTITNPNYLKFKEGQHIIGHFMSQDTSLVRLIHPMILKELPKLTKTLANNYGTVYFIAWSYAVDDDVQKEVEVCIQDIMNRAIEMPRRGLEMPKPGVNLLAVLSKLHESRKAKNFSHVLNDLYAPVLWRALESADPWHRCNGAQVFLDVFPLEKPLSAATENAEYMEKQIGQIKALLLDDSHFVRTITVKGVCSGLVASLELYSISRLREICYILFDQLPRDGSSYIVRKAVFEGLESLLGAHANEDGTICTNLLEPILPCLRTSLHDVNEKVRRAFIKFLIRVKERSEYLNITYWEICSVKEILLRLSIEGPGVGALICQLLKEHVYTYGQPVTTTITRLCKMLDWTLEGTKNHFRYSEKVYSPKEAYTIIISIIGYIRRHLQGYIAYQNSENKKSRAKSSRGKTKAGRKGSLEDISNTNLDGDENCDSDSSCSTTASSVTPSDSMLSIYELLDSHKYMCGLIQVATIVWVVFRQPFSAVDDGNCLDKLYALASVTVPMFLKYYKGTPVYYATVQFSSLIPINKLRPVSTVSSACISELKVITEETDQSVLESLIYSLCAWNRGHDVLELAAEWLNFAFREQNLNNTAQMPKDGQKKSKVRFQQTDGKPLLALKLVDVLFSDVLNESRLLQKSYDQMVDFYNCLERILIILERKMTDPSSFNKPGTNLTDEFIVKAYTRYLHLMHTLHKDVAPENVQPEDPPPFDSIQAAARAITWASNVLVPHVPHEGYDEVPPLAVRCCLAVLNESTLAVSLNNANEELARALCLFISDLLSLNKAEWFLEGSIFAMEALTEYAQVNTLNDEWYLLKRILPSLLEKVLSVITDFELTEEAATKFFKDIPKLRIALFALPKVLLEKYRAKDDVFLDTYRNIIHTCVLMVQQEIKNEDEVLFHKKIDQHPFFVSFILKYVLIRSALSKQLIPAIEYVIKTFRQDGYKLLSCLSILYTLACCGRTKFPNSLLEEALQLLCTTILKYSGEKPTPQVEKESQDVPHDDSSSFSSATTSVTIDVQKVALPVFNELKEILNCAIVGFGNPVAVNLSVAEPQQQEPGNENEGNNAVTELSVSAGLGTSNNAVSELPVSPRLETSNNAVSELHISAENVRTDADLETSNNGVSELPGGSENVSISIDSETSMAMEIDDSLPSQQINNS